MVLGGGAGQNHVGPCGKRGEGKKMYKKEPCGLCTAPKYVIKIKCLKIKDVLRINNGIERKLIKLTYKGTYCRDITLSSASTQAKHEYSFLHCYPTRDDNYHIFFKFFPLLYQRAPIDIVQIITY